jgi:hypothetical protein
MSNIPLQILKRYARYVPARLKTLEDLIPFGALQPQKFVELLNEKPGPYEIPFIQDSEKKYWKNDSWSYHINCFNFRDEWNFDDNRKKIGFFGCSFTVGEGIKSEDTFVNKVGDKLNLNSFNFGSGGAGIERVARTFSAVSSLINLDYAVVTLPAWHRQLHTGELGDMINLIPSYPHSGFERICKTLTQLDEDYYASRAASNINWIYDIAKYKGIKILFSSWDHTTNAFCKEILPDSTLNHFPNIDDKCARDKMHPGNKSQQAHADQIIKAFNDRAWI